MIQPSERGKWHPVSVSLVGCVQYNSISKIRVVCSRCCISPKYIPTREIIDILDCIKESRILCLHMLQVVQYVMTPTTKGTLSSDTHLCCRGQGKVLVE